MTRKAAIRLVLDAWRAAGFRDYSNAAVALVQAHEEGRPLRAVVPADFCARNDCDEEWAAGLAANALEGVVIEREMPTILMPEEINSFERIADVGPRDVISIPRPLPIPEVEVKRMLLDIIGEAEIPTDHGAERSDAFSTLVYLDGRRITTSFVLKGPAKKGELTPKDYGANGDQLQRSFTQPASLHIIQANASLAPSVREAINGYVLDTRSKGDARAAASLWDGTDTARILAAYGYIDPADGRVLR